MSTPAKTHKTKGMRALSNYDIWRLVLLVICAASFFILLNRFRLNRQSWNTKTRDYWYALTAWTFATAMSCLEGLLRHLPGRYSIVLTTAAAIVTLMGVLRRGPWGGPDTPRVKKHDKER